jgi:putative peptide maturation system protein
MNESLQAAVRDALALLSTLRKERVPTDEAMSRLRALRERHPAHWMNMVWERETFGDVIHYDILIGSEGDTLSLSYCADEETPWPVRGLQRINESLVVRVNDDPIYIHQAITSLDYAWHTLHVSRHLIDMSLIDQELRLRPVEVTDEELAEALTAFRRKRRLFTVAQVERWMHDHGTTQVQLETHLRDDVARAKLRARVSAGREDAYFHDHRADFDRVQVARLYTPSEEQALKLHAQLRERPEDFLAVAQTCFLERGQEDSLFMTLQRGELHPEQAELLFSTRPGQVTLPVPSGDGYELAQVLAFVPARLDAVTRQQVRDALFEQWLEERRRTARVEWFWGAAEAADVPALAL